MKTIHRTLTLVAVLALLCPLAILAQSKSNRQGPYQNVEIQVKDLDSDQVIGVIQPGGRFTLREGQRVRLIMTAIQPGRGKGPAYPETEFTESEPGRGWVRVTRTNVENANATLEIRRPSDTNRNRTETLHYRIVENIGIPENLRQGTITIHAEPGVGASTAPSTSDSRAQQLTNTLYRAILLRDMDPAGQPYVDRIASGGYSELIRVAEEIASSEESRDDAFDRAGRSLEQRLAALYQNLLGLSMSQVENDQRFEDMRRMRAGQVDDVVAGIIQSTRFQEYHKLSDWMAVRY